MLKKCPCGKSFVPKNIRQKYCEPACEDRFRMRKARLLRTMAGKCPQCGGEMDYPIIKYNYKNKKQTLSYCSKCREKFRKYYKENKEE